jgi:hypothetical protein
MGKITTIKREIEINQSKDKVWKALADFGNICHGHPAVSKSFITSAQKEGVGATRHCDFTMMGASAEEKVTEWNDGKNIKIEVQELKKMPGIKTMALDLAIRNSGRKNNSDKYYGILYEKRFFQYDEQFNDEKNECQIVEMALWRDTNFILKQALS